MMRALRILLIGAFVIGGTVPAQAQGTLIPFAPQTFVDANGNPLAGSKLCSYAAGTSTAQATYSASTLTVGNLNANPIIMAANGRPTSGAIFLSPTSYKFVFREAGTTSTCADGTILWTLDNVRAVPTTSGNVDVTGTAGAALTAGQIAYLSNGDGALTNGRWYAADADLPYASSNAAIVAAVTADIASGAEGTFRLVGQVTGLSGLTAGAPYYISATAGGVTSTPPTFLRLLGSADSTTTLLFGTPRPLTTNPLAVAEGRLTLTTGEPVTTGDVSAATTLYYALYKGNRIALYDSTAALWNTRSFTQLSITLVGLTTSRPYDVWIYDSAGTPAMELLVWTSATARATALTKQDGVYVKTGDATRRYVGTVYINATGGQSDDTYAKRYVWNYYNRVPRPMRVLPTDDTWDYTTDTWRQANAAAANQLDVMVGVAEVPIVVNLFVLVVNTNVGALVYAGIGEDSTTVPATGSFIARIGTYVANFGEQLTASYTTFPAVGRHTYVWLEKSSAVGTTTWFGDGGAPTNLQTGISGVIEG